MSEQHNRRLVHENAIKRMKNFVDSRKFLESDSATLTIKKEFLERSYSDFLEEHKKVVAWVKKEDFHIEDSHMERVEENYQEMIIDFRRQISAMEQYKLMSRIGAESTVHEQNKSRNYTTQKRRGEKRGKRTYK